jgi:DNA end-binding protein Ku
MKPRSIWTGFLKISLVTVPIRVYTALNPGEKVAFNQLHKGCNRRLRQKLVCPVHGEVGRDCIVKGYEYCTDQFVTVDESDLAKIRLETTRILELFQFVQPGEVDPVFLDSPYYVGANGPAAAESFGVVREALRRTKLMAIGRVVISGKEKLVALKPLGMGFGFFTLRHLSEIRPVADYFQDVPPITCDQAQLALAQQLIQGKCAPFDSSAFHDRYQAALLELIQNKVKGTEPVLVPRNDAVQIIDLMSALRQSMAQFEQHPEAQGSVGPQPSKERVNGNGAVRSVARRKRKERNAR